jgi:AP2 domain.
MPVPPKPTPPADYLHERLSYDPTSGLLTWKEFHGFKNFNTRYAGKQAGRRSGLKTQVCLHRHLYQTHRIIWKMMTGDDPTDFIDHIDRNSHNNRWNNLRLVKHIENIWNSSMRKDNTSGYIGVSRDRSAWSARIRINGKEKHLGNFPNPEEASLAYKAAIQRVRGHFLDP